jgi:hypothetical protein
MAAGAITKVSIFLAYYIYVNNKKNIENIKNMLENGLVLVTGDRSGPLDKGKGKAIDDEESIYEPLNKGKRKATDDESIYESLDKGKRRAIDYDNKNEGSSKDNQNNDSESDSSPGPDPDPNSGSDIESDPELNDDIQESIDELKEKVKDAPDYKIYEEIDTLEQLLHYKYKRREPLPPVPDF